MRRFNKETPMRLTRREIEMALECLDGLGDMLTPELEAYKYKLEQDLVHAPEGVDLPPDSSDD